MMSAPERTRSALRPTKPARRFTTIGSSPERIFSWTPDAASLAIAAAAVAFGGSAKAQNPSKTRSVSSGTVTSWALPAQERDAIATARSPSSARACTRSRAAARSTAPIGWVWLPLRLKVHNASTASGAPFAISSLPSGPVANTDPSLRSKSNAWRDASVQSVAASGA